MRRTLISMSPVKIVPFKSVLNQFYLFTIQQIRCKGHSKWQNIKSTKEANDQAKARIIGKYVTLIRKCVIDKGPDPKSNVKLAGLLLDAKKNNVPIDTINRNIKRASELKTIPTVLELLGPAGSLVVLNCEAINKGKLRQEIFKVCKKFKGTTLLRDGQAKNAFEERGILRIQSKSTEGEAISFEKAEEIAIESGAEEIKVDQDDPDVYEFITAPVEIYNVKKHIEDNFKLIDIIEAEVELFPRTKLELPDDNLEEVSKFLEELQENPEVDKVYVNIE